MAAEPTTDLTEFTGTDTRYVAIIWRNDDDGNGRPGLMLGGCSEFEAVGLLRAALARLEECNTELIDLDGVDEDEYADDDDD